MKITNETNGRYIPLINKNEIVDINDLKEGDIFSFRTEAKPIWWRFIQIKQGSLIYEEIRSKYRHSLEYIFVLVKKRIK
jgi:hypothetical protein